MVRDMVEESSSDKWKILRGDWREQCTEIDFVAISGEKKTVVWGSNKLSAKKQDPLNQLCHVVSYFNNRLWQNDPYFSFRHVFLFISVQEDQKNRFNTVHEPLNVWLVQGRSRELEDLCKQKLSNHEGGGKQFQWYEGRKQADQDSSSKNSKKKKGTSSASTTTVEPTASSSTALLSDPIIATTETLPPTTPDSNRQPIPIQREAYFVISSCHALDMDDLINGVQLDNFVPLDP